MFLEAVCKTLINMSCPMHFNKTLDLCYCSIKGTYKSVVQPPVGTADDNTALLVPVYKNDLKRERSQTKSIMWSKESTAYLQGCLGCMDWLFLCTTPAWKLMNLQIMLVAISYSVKICSYPVRLSTYFQTISHVSQNT